MSELPRKELSIDPTQWLPSVAIRRMPTVFFTCTLSGITTYMLQAHALGVVLWVKHFADALTFLTESLEFPVRQKGPNWAVLDNGSTSLRLLQSEENGPSCTLDVATDDLDGTRAKLGELGYVCTVADFVTAERRAFLVETEFGFNLLVGRDYNEDELGQEKDLVVHLDWSPEAKSTVAQVAADVPVGFRDLMRKKTVERAEALAVLHGEISVSTDLAVRALLQTTPDFQLSRLKEKLTAIGVDLSLFSEDLESAPT